MLIDAHCHVWRIGEHGHEWPTPDLSAIYRNFAIEDLTRAAGDDPVAGVVVVQSQPSQADTLWLLELAARDPLIRGVVGWCDLAALDAPEQIAALAQDPWLKGLRPMLQDLDDDCVLDPALEPAIAAMIAADLSFDALVRPRHLPALLQFVERWPALRVVIDHGAKPEITDGRLDPWRARMTALAGQPNVFCKLSGLLTEAGDQANADALAPYVAHLVEVFGPDRLMWGSDWPVLNLAGDYRSWRSMCLPWIASEHHSALFGETAKRFYRL